MENVLFSVVLSRSLNAKGQRNSIFNGQGVSCFRLEIICILPLGTLPLHRIGRVGYACYWVSCLFAFGLLLEFEE